MRVYTKPGVYIMWQLSNEDKKNFIHFEAISDEDAITTAHRIYRNDKLTGKYYFETSKREIILIF